MVQIIGWPRATAVLRVIASGSYTGVPRVTELRGRRADALADPVETLDDRDTGEEFDALVAKLAGDPQPERRAVIDRQLFSIHAIRQQRLRMQGIAHIKTVPPLVERKEDDVARAGT